jgi:alpha-glucosidase (family GH31 glycosyl hydrolase)
MGPALNNIPDNLRFNRIELHCWSPYPAEAFVYDDDGTTRAYLKGEYSITRIYLKNTDNTISIRLSPTESSFSGQPEACHIKLILHQVNQPEHITIDGELAIQWKFDQTQLQFTI